MYIGSRVLGQNGKPLKSRSLKKGQIVLIPQKNGTYLNAIVIKQKDGTIGVVCVPAVMGELVWDDTSDMNGDVDPCWRCPGFYQMEQ